MPRSHDTPVGKPLKLETQACDLNGEGLMTNSMVSPSMPLDAKPKCSKSSTRKAQPWRLYRPSNHSQESFRTFGAKTCAESLFSVAKTHEGALVAWESRARAEDNTELTSLLAQLPRKREGGDDRYRLHRGKCPLIPTCPESRILRDF